MWDMLHKDLTASEVMASIAQSTAAMIIIATNLGVSGACSAARIILTQSGMSEPVSWGKSHSFSNSST